MLGHADFSYVTVIVVNWNGRRYLPHCLQALQHQTFKNFRVLVMDNGSTDGSEELVGDLNDSRFTMVQLQSNLGFARANNLGVEQAGDSKWVALLNPDAFPEPNWLECLLAAADHCSAGAAFGSQLLSAENPALLDGSGDNYHLSGRAFARDHGQPHLGRACSSDEIFSPCAAAALYLRSAWLAVGGMDEDYFCYLEDVDLGFRLRLQGHQCWYVPEAICHHMGSALTGRRSDFTTYHGQRNLVWTYVKNMPGLLFWLLLPLHLLLNWVALVFFVRHGQSRVIWRAKRDALRGLPQIWRKRQSIQRGRSVSVRAIWRVLDKSFFPLS
jgi:GT2 family glycosyltransferase